MTVALTHWFILGLKDSLNIYWTVYFIWTSKKIRKATIRCVLLNGVLFIGSIVLLHYAFMPLIGRVGKLFMLKDGPPNVVIDKVQHFAEGIVGLLFNLFWILPLYLVSVLMNSIWYSRISNEVFELHHGVKSKPNLNVTIRESFYRAVLLLFYSIECVIVYEAFPIVGPVFSTILMCFINALYSFEGVWAMQGIKMQQRLALIETCWPYFMGFGTPVALVCSFWSTFTGLGLFAVCFPACLIQATCSSFSTPSSSRDITDASQIYRLPVFKLSLKCSDIVLKGVNDLFVVKRRRK